MRPHVPFDPSAFLPEVVERFWSRVDKGPGKECWLWVGAKFSSGYGGFRIGARVAYAHRWAYVQANGEHAQGLTLDHLCHTRACVNPSHLEAVTIAENNRRANAAGGGSGAWQRRKTHCPHGHEYSGANLIRTRGQRVCRECQRARNRKRDRRKG